jgi:hypothetical protein
VGIEQNARHDPLFAMRRARSIYRKNRNAFSDIVFSSSDDSAFGKEKNDRMPELQGAVSDRINRLIVIFKTQIKNEIAGTQTPNVKGGVFNNAVLSTFGETSSVEPAPNLSQNQESPKERLSNYQLSTFNYPL